MVIGMTLALVSSASAQQFKDQTITRFPVQAEYTNQLSFCDVDDDGDLDIAFADGQGYASQGAALRAKLYINDGEGRFTDESTTRIPVTGWFRGVEFGDVDRDGDWDMVLANDFNKKPVLLLNDGTGVFVEESAEPAENELYPTFSRASTRGSLKTRGSVDSWTITDGGARSETVTPAALPPAMVAADRIFRPKRRVQTVYL